MNTVSFFFRSVCVLSLMGFGIVGCGKNSGDVTVESESYSTASSQLKADEFNKSDNALVAITDFKICVGKVKLENEDDHVEKKDDEDEIVFKPGLIDISSGAAKSWGAMNIPTGFKLKKIKVKVKKDKDLCGVDYSVSFNGYTSPQDIEFKWKFDPPIEINIGDTVLLSLSSVVSALRTAIDNGSISSLKDRIEEAEGSCRKK